MLRRSAVVFALTLLAAIPAHACDVADACESEVGFTCSGRMALNVCPFGDFELIRNACNPPGVQYIYIVAKGCGGAPVPGIPVTDYWMNSCDPSNALYLCANPITADSVTGSNGRTTFSGHVAGGGCNIPAHALTGQGVYWAIQGEIIKGPACGSSLCLELDVKSPDLTGVGGPPDGQVDLSDLVVFGISYNTAWGVSPPPGKAFNACSDFNDDWTCNLSDLAYFAMHYQHKCQ